MISAEEFVRRWETEIWPPGEEDPLIRFSKALVDGLAIPSEDKEFLWKAGLPKSAAPCLQFEKQTEDNWSILPREYMPSEDYRQVYLIGYSGCGDPVAIDGTAFGWVVELLHEFQFSRVFVNSSIRHLAACLLVYRDFVTDSQKMHGGDAYVTGNIPPTFRQRVEQQIGEIDAPALDAGCFWREQLEATDYMMNDYRRPIVDFSKGKI